MPITAISMPPIAVASNQRVVINQRGPLESTKPMSRVERTKSFLKKRWKSSKELFRFSSSEDSTTTKISRKTSDNSANVQSSKFINEKVLDNLDEFERNFLLSAGRKILVRELRKNFEKPATGDTLNNSTKPPMENGAIQIAVPFKNNNHRNIDEPKRKMTNGVQRSMSTSVQNVVAADSYAKNVYGAMPCGAVPLSGEPKKPTAALMARHSSFYNTYRNTYEYCTWQNNNCASNLSLVSCGVATQNNCEKKLAKTINDYKNSIKSSSAIDLTTIPSFVLNTTVSTITSSIEKSSLLRKHRYSSVISINHVDSNQNLTDSSALSKNNNENSKCIKMNVIDASSSSPAAAMVNDRLVVRKNCQLKQTCSMKSLNNAAAMYHGKTNHYDRTNHFRNLDDDTKSMIVTSNTSCNLYDNARSADVMTRNYFCGSNITLNSEIDYQQQSMPNDYTDKYIDDNSSRIINGTKATTINEDGDTQDGNNNTMKLRKSYSINQIDLNLLKNELDEFIDREWRTTNFGKNTIAHRRRHFESELKKVQIFYSLISFSLSSRPSNNNDGCFFC